MRASLGTMKLAAPSAVSCSGRQTGWPCRPLRLGGQFDDPSAFDPETRCRFAGYQTRQSLAADQMIDAAEALIPALRTRTVFRREASPVSFRRHGYSTQGAVYGAQGPAAAAQRGAWAGLRGSRSHGARRRTGHDVRRGSGRRAVPWHPARDGLPEQTGHALNCGKQPARQSR